MAGRLYRSRRDRMIAGVAGGLAEMWGADPSLVRIIWALLVILTGGAALLVYIVMAIVVPDEDTVYGPAGVPVADRRAGAPRTGGMSPAVLIGAFLIVLGGFFLLREIFPRIDFDWIWPLALVGLGVVLIVVAMTATPVDPRFQIPSRRVVFLALALVALFWFARPVMLPFVVGAIVAYAFSPAIDSLQARTGRSRLLVVVMSYAAGLLVLAAIAIAFAGPVSREASLLIRSGPDALTTAIHQVLGADSLTIGDRTFTVEEISLQAKAALDAFLQTPEGALLAAQQLLHGLLDIVLILIVTFFLLLDGERFGSTVLRFIDPNDRSKVQQIAARTHVVVGQWMRGQLILVVFVSVIVTIVLGPILHLPNAAALGVMRSSKAHTATSPRSR